MVIVGEVIQLRADLTGDVRVAITLIRQGRRSVTRTRLFSGRDSVTRTRLVSGKIDYHLYTLPFFFFFFLVIHYH